MRIRYKGRQMYRYGCIHTNTLCHCQSHMRTHTKQSSPAVSPWPDKPCLCTFEQMCVEVMSLVFVQQGFVNKSSITAAICFCVDREQQPTRWERCAGCVHSLRNRIANPKCPSFFLSVTFFFLFFSCRFISVRMETAECRRCECNLLFSSVSGCF